MWACVLPEHFPTRVSPVQHKRNLNVARKWQQHYNVVVMLYGKAAIGS